MAWVEEVEGIKQVRATLFEADLPESQHRADTLTILTISNATSSVDDSNWFLDDVWEGGKKYAKNSVSSALSDGQAHLAWSESGALMAATYNRVSASWDVADLGLSDAAYYHAMTDKGELVAVAGDRLYVARYDAATASWTVSDSIDDDLVTQAGMSVLRENGAIQIAYIKSGGAGNQLIMATVAPQTLEPSLSLVADTDATKKSPALTFYGGEYYLAWRQPLVANEHGLVYARSTGIAWQETVVDGAIAMDLDLVVADDGVHLLWTDEDYSNKAYSHLIATHLQAGQYGDFKILDDFGSEEPIAVPVDGGIAMMVGQNGGRGIVPISYSEADGEWGMGDEVCIVLQYSGWSSCQDGDGDLGFAISGERGVVSWVSGDRDIYISTAKN
ncbi:hypothetical protein CHH28_14460 [Bacterioplanes sanyensis]|uniref:Uncharacterized protein n=1 Tax=Bacterioplanes sanyensis TaxID=1249553 RepID=A0A222FM14_9GAMM|nr:hypothetical protein CHH28_14460 [Bacterioplanes sanyensis]